MVASEPPGWILPRAVRPETSPGRWVGGAVGGLVCVCLILLGRPLASGGGSPGYFFYLSADSLQTLGLAGLPIAILGGRALLPRARSGDLSTALVVGLRFGLLAPPLGAIELMAFSMVNGTGQGLFVLPFFMIVSYVVAVATIPCGLLWALIVRAIPESALLRLDVTSAMVRPWFLQ